MRAGRFIGLVLMALSVPAAASACAIEPLSHRLDRLFEARVVALAEVTVVDAFEGDLDDVVGYWKPQPDQPSVPLLYIVTAKIRKTVVGEHRESWTLLWRGADHPVATPQIGFVGIIDGGASAFPDYRERLPHRDGAGHPTPELIPNMDACNCVQNGLCNSWPVHFDPSEESVVRDAARERAK